ncbi:intermembrane lipid transfer protein VPS13A isoform X3 [Halyomorpha halys]|uniref:intermembrane lipid transfer protein VPS13A isoform X3 n=1 Tax=Halyomorpha halys TaxID=286706 RepID=UPI0006D4F755|nr:vacuolar protein sorting-associated protein 13A-like isoform X3 [Halyomorpha halys]
MFERVVATLLHRYLGKYIQDLDTENLNVGIFGGDVQLSDLKIKPDALYELDLPIEVKVGTIGRINIKIPWGCFNKQSVAIEMEDIYVIVAPITDREYDPEKEKRLIRASKRRKLELLEIGHFLGTDAPESPSFVENLITTIMNNLQVFIHNIHVRYEDSKLNSDSLFAFGLCLQSLSIETTNSKWKPTTSQQGLSSVYQMVKVESLSIYCNPGCSQLVGKAPGQDSAAPYTWRSDMKRGLETFSVKGEEFEFILKPITAKMKLIVNKSNEARVPKLLVDFVLQDAATQLSRQQYLVLIDLMDSFKRININRKYRQYHPNKSVSGNVACWWKYLYNGVLEQRVRPYTWSRISTHRKNYRRYRDIYKQTLLKPTDTELKLDLQQCEDLLSITDIIIAREDAKIQLLKEEPERVKAYEKGGIWWKKGADSEPHPELHVTAGTGRGIWAQLSPSEKTMLCDAIGYNEAASGEIEKPKQYIEHKVNFTLANCSLSLLNRGHEVMVLTLAQFLASLETRPSAKAFKLSGRVESFVIEGISLEHDLVPIITADNIYTGNTASNFLSIDFEKNPLNSEADYGLTINLEPVEIVYHEHAISELMSFVQTATESLSQICYSVTDSCLSCIKSVSAKAIRRCSAMELNIDLKLPYIVLPELGTLQKGGNLLIIDLGHIKISSELQPNNINLEDATQMEMEEKLYDRFYMEFSEFQVLFCDSGDLWRDAKKLNDSEFHLLPKLQSQVAFSNSIKPEYRLLPRHKLNITLSSIKFNISDRKIGSVMDFLDNIPLPSPNTVHVSISSNVVYLASIPELTNDEFRGDPTVDLLTRIKILIVEAELKKQNKIELSNIDKAGAKMAMLQVDKNFISSEVSDEENEQWARTVDLPGFDDNVSPNNIINMLLRFMIGEIVVQLCRSCNRIDKPYLMLRISKICCDAALMEYGPAIQATLGSVQLVDKLHTGNSGEYLELISTDPSSDVASLLYRKVRSDCPDFKSHFHSVEQSLVLDFNRASIILHREAFVTLNKYLQYLLQKVQSREIVLWHKLFGKWTIEPLSEIWEKQNDPPIPPGATKFSYSTRLQELKLKFCDTEMEFLEIKIGGLESDCLFKANERMVLRFYLSSITIDDLSDMTLYPKILSIEDEKVLDMKYVRHSPRFYKNPDIDNKKDDVKSDGNLKIHVGRIQLVFFCKMILDFQQFMEPFVRPALIPTLICNLEKYSQEKFSSLRTCNTRLHLAIDIRTPSFLFPQKISSPNLIIFCLGDLSVENFFKEKSSPVENVPAPVIDNVLIRLENIQICRAVMTLAGSLEIQEPIVDPLSVKFDVKRAVDYHSTVRALTGIYVQPTSQLLLYQIVGNIDNIRINLGQRDLSTILNVWVDNFNQGIFIGEVTNNWTTPSSPIEAHTPVPPAEDQAVKKLQAFFFQNEPVRREGSVRFTLDSMQVYLFSDCDEILSSPVRDMNQGLCKLETGEATMTLDVLSDKSLELKMALQTCLVEDIRKETDPSNKKILQSHTGSTQVEDSNISVSTPPIIDVTFRQTQTGDKCVDVLVEALRLSLSISFVLDLSRFILDSLPPDRIYEGGLVNHGYVGDSNIPMKQSIDTVRPPSSADSTSGYFSLKASCMDEQTGISISVQIRRPEIMLYSSSGHTLLLRTEVLADYSRHPGRESFVFSLSGLRLLCKHQVPHKDQHPYIVLHPCDIEFAKSQKMSDDGLKITLSIGLIDVHITPNTVHAITALLEEVNTNLMAEEPDGTNVLYGSIETDDLWSPKKISPYTFPHQSSYCCGTMGRMNEIFTAAIPKLRIIFELEDSNKRVPMVLLKAATEVSVHNWSKYLQMKGELQIQISYYNSKVGAWEPLLEPCVEEEGVYRPYEILFKVFRAKAYPIQPCMSCDESNEKEMSSSLSKLSQSKSLSRVANSEESETSADEQDVETGSMMFIRKKQLRNDHKKSKHESISLISYPEDSDSDNEEGVMEKLASAISHLFTGDSSDGEASDSNDSSGAEPSADTDDNTDVESMTSAHHPPSGKESRAIFLKKQSDSVDSGLETEGVDKVATYVMIESRDRLELSVTPQSISVLTSLHQAFTLSAPIPMENELSLINDIAPSSTITLLSKAEVGPPKVLMTSTYERSDSMPSSPASTPPTDFFSPLGSEGDPDYPFIIQSLEDGFYSRKTDPEVTSELYSPYMRFPIEPVSCLYKKITDQRVRIHIPGFEEMEVLCPQRTCNKLHFLQPIKNNTRYYIVLNVECHDWGQKITVRSPLQVKNETSYAIAVYYKKAVLETLGYTVIGESTNPFEDMFRIAVIEPDEVFNVPLTVAHHCKLYVQPAYVDNYSICDTGLWWQDLASDLNTPKDIVCSAKEESEPTVFSVRAFCEEGSPIWRPSRLIPKYLIRLLPPLAFHNRLPYAIEVKVPSIKYEVRIEAGEKASIYFLNLLRTHKISIHVPSYLGILWTGTFNLSPDVEEKIVTMTTEQDTEGGNKQLGLSLKVERGETCDVMLHAPYWIINKTGLPLQIRASLTDVVYEAQGEEPLLFCYRKQRKQCIRLRAYHSSWSSAFSLDAFSSSGLVICKDRERKRRYRILLKVELSEVCPHLTKIVTLLPNFIVSNECKRPLRFMEENEKADLWIDLSPTQTLAFWPDTEKMNMFVKFRDSKVVSQHFPITSNHDTVLRMDKGGGLVVSVIGGGDKPFSIIFRSYSPGDAPVRVENLCEDLFLKIHQQHLGQVALLSPYQSLLYTWDDPCKERTLLWNVYNKKSKDFMSEIWKDGYGQERVSFHMVRKQGSAPTSSQPPTVTAKLSASLKRLSTPLQSGQSSSSEDSESDELQKPQLSKKTRKDKVVVYWVSYLEGPQRVLMFTQDERIAYKARLRIDSEKSNVECFLSLKGIGLSLASEITNQLQEVAYFSARDSAPIWEVNVAHKWKPLTLELAAWVEDRWRQDAKKAQMKEFVHVDFEKMQMTKPFYGELRRRYNPALWLQYRKSQNYSHIHAKLHKFQIENQMNNAVFPIVLYPKPLSSQVVRKVGVKPCFEIVVLKRNESTQNQLVIKYMKVLIQEFSIQLEKNFVLLLYDLCSSWLPETKPSVRIRRDIGILYQPLTTWSSPCSESRMTVEYMHLSPISLQFSFVFSGTNMHASIYDRSYYGDLMHYLLDMLTPAHPEIKGINIRTSYFEWKGLVINRENYISEIISHYTSQLIPQIHVLILGLDILGNPYSVVTDFTHGLGDMYYDPALNQIENAEEFSEGLSLGAQMLMGHLCAGGSGNSSLITTALPDGVTPPNFDDDYKKRRRLCLQQMCDLPDLLIQNNRTFEVGITLGMSGLIIKHLTGIQQHDGLEAFFRSVGKGLMGLLTKPSGGVVDCIAMATDGIKRAAETGEEFVLRTRQPRYLNPYLGVKPFSVFEAGGKQLLMVMNKGHYADSDIYWTHAPLQPDGKSYLLITLQHVFFVEKCRLWGTWEMEWGVRVDDIMSVPNIEDNKLMLKVRQDESFNYLNGNERAVQCQDPALLQWLQKKIEAVMILNMEDKPCPIAADT